MVRQSADRTLDVVHNVEWKLPDILSQLIDIKRVYDLGRRRVRICDLAARSFWFTSWFRMFVGASASNRAWMDGQVRFRTMAVNSPGQKPLVRTANETRMETIVQEAGAFCFIYLHVTSLFFAEKFEPDYLTNNIKLHLVPSYYITAIEIHCTNSYIS